MNVVFFGNTQFSAIGLEIIHQQLGISTVITIPDRFDKKKGVVQSPTKIFAQLKKINVLEASKLSKEVIEQIALLHPDFFVVEDYGLILPKELLAIPKYAPLNIHHSLLPKYRGPSPAPSAILAGDKTSGVSVIHMNERVDAGDIYGQTHYNLSEHETTETLLTVLNKLGGELVVQVIQDVINGKAKHTPQHEHDATLTYFMEKKHGYFDIDNPPSPTQLDRMIRAYYPWPGVWTRVEINKQTKIVKLLPNKQIQVEGKKEMSMKDFFNGYPELKTQMEQLLG